MAVEPCDEIPRQSVTAETTQNIRWSSWKDGKTEITRVTADGNGNYRVALAPGNYILDVQDRKHKHVRVTAQRFTVVSNKTVRVDMDIDTGIR